jgi:hypothetical protein
MVVPRIETSQANAVPVSSNPEIIWQQNFNAACPKYWEGLGYPVVPNAQWTVDTCPGERYGFGSRPGQSGMYRADGSGDILAQGTIDMMVPRGMGWNGTNGLVVTHHPTQLGSGVEMPNVKLSALNGAELEEAWFRVLVWFGPTFHGFIDGSGGKLPGFKNLTDYCAGSGVKANGYCGWTLRNGFRIGADPQNPGHGHVRIDTYAYHAEQTDFTGSSWAGDYRALVPLEQWACIEQRVKVNTPGVKDGINQLYINGVLVLDRQIYLRGPRPSEVTGNPAHGYGDWWYTGAGFPTEPAGAPRIVDPVTGKTLFWRGGANLNSNLAIDGLYWVQHGGGGKPIGKPGVQMRFDEFVISKGRAGCPSTDTPPPPAEQCGDGIDNDLDGQVDEDCPPPVEVCGDMIDNDNDGLIDEDCLPPPVEICGDLIDNNGNGEVDEGCPPPPVEVCGDGADNNGDGQVDEDCPPPLVELCGDQVDNDEDGVIDEDCPVPPTELELVTKALAQALVDLEIAQARAAVAETNAQTLGAMLNISIAQTEEAVRRFEEAVEETQELTQKLKRIADILTEVE